MIRILFREILEIEVVLLLGSVAVVIDITAIILVIVVVIIVITIVDGVWCVVQC